jgi:LacI family transcriptional regulator
MKTVTITDIATLAKVSHTTVSRVLSGSSLVNKKTAEKVEKIAEELGYVPNAMAKGLVSNTTKTIGMVIPDIMNPFFPEVAKGVEDYCSTMGFKMFLCNSDMKLDKERNYIDQLFSYRSDGIIILPVSDSIDHIVKRYPDLKRVVFLSYRPDNSVSRYNYVGADDNAVTETATQYLIRIGHKRIAFFGGPATRSILNMRYSGYRKAMDDNGLNICSYNLNLDESDSDELLKESNLSTTVQQMLMDKDSPTAIVAYNDIIALQIMELVEQFGLRVPDDISIIGTDDISMAGNYRIGLTTISQNKYLLGSWAAKILIERIASETDDRYQQKTMTGKLIIRNSTKPL